MYFFRRIEQCNQFLEFYKNVTNLSKIKKKISTLCYKKIEVIWNIKSYIFTKLCTIWIVFEQLADKKIWRSCKKGILQKLYIFKSTNLPFNIFRPGVRLGRKMAFSPVTPIFIPFSPPKLPSNFPTDEHFSFLFITTPLYFFQSLNLITIFFVQLKIIVRLVISVTNSIYEHKLKTFIQIISLQINYKMYTLKVFVSHSK